MHRLFLIAALTMTLGASSCKDVESTDVTSSKADTEGMSLEAQIGPITRVELGDIDAALVAAGDKTFTLRCTACHQLETAGVGPPLGGVLEKRSPEYVMNMILNPTEMLQRHPEAQAMLEYWAVPMADLGISEEEARAILEFLR